MGNIWDKIGEKKIELTLGAMTGVLAVIAYYQRLDTMQLRRIGNSIDPYIPSISHQLQENLQDMNEKVLIRELLKYRENPIYRIAITGGPCAGKSTALEHIKQYFSQAGFIVMVVPEIPTLVSYGGGLSDFGNYGSKDRMIFQLNLMHLKIYFEDYIAKLAQMSKKPVLILCDRGLVDCAAYMTKQQYQALLDESGWTWSHIRDKRYDSVIFMNTAAKGAEQFYTLANNQARSQSPQQARDLDDRTLAAWIGHPYMTLVPNTPGKSFEYKVDLTIKAVQKTIGLESLTIYYHKFLVEVDKIPEEVKVIQSTIEQIFLKNQNSRYTQDRIKKRGQDNSYTYQRRYVGPYVKSSTFRQVRRVCLNSLQYYTLAENEADPYYRPVHTKRKSFEWNSHYFSLDFVDYIKGYHNPIVLRFQADIQLDPLPMIPPWVKVIRNVRDERIFNMSSIAYRDY